MASTLVGRDVRVFITGAAGYVGSMLVPRLLAAGYSVCGYDSLLHGLSALFPYFINPQFCFIRGDMRDRERLRTSVRDFQPDFIIHLAAVVGYPACARDPDLARAVNIQGTANLAEVSENIPIVLASTGSAYGKVEGVCTEETPVDPLSLYGQTKRSGEEILQRRGNVICLRFATAFGLAPRLRLDLMINDFAFQAVLNRQLILYESHYRRTFIHVTDMARSLEFAIINFDRMHDQVFNVGDEQMNYTKREVAEAIKAKMDYYLHFAEIGQDMDQRDYEVSYQKIHGLGFYTEIDLDRGLDELIKAFQHLDFGGTSQVMMAQRSFSNVLGGQ